MADDKKNGASGNSNTTFQVDCRSAELLANANAIIDNIQKDYGISKKYEAFAVMVKVVNTFYDRYKMQTNGVDVDALDSAFDNIRSQFAAAAKARIEIQTKFDNEKVKIEDKYKKEAENMQARIDQLKEEKTSAEDAKKAADGKAAEADKKARDTENRMTEYKTDADEAIKAAQDRAKKAEELADEKEKLIQEKDRNNATVLSKLTEAEAKAAQYDALKKEADESKEKVKELQAAAKQAEEKHEYDLDRARMEKERELRDEYEEKLRKADREAAMLSAKLELLRNQGGTQSPHTP